MDVIEALQKRRSIRKYKKDKVSQENIDILMHGAMSGPSAVNKTPWEFYVVTNEEVLNKLRKASKFTNIVAPLAIVVCGNKSRFLPFGLDSYWIQDCSSATENILLAATELGLGSLWCGIYPQNDAVKKVKEILDLSDKYIPLNIIYIGYSDEEKEARDQYKEKYIHIID